MKTALQRKMASVDVDVETVANYLGRSKNCVYDKIAGRSDFTVPEMWAVSGLLGLSNEEMLECFPARSRKIAGRRLACVV